MATHTSSNAQKHLAVLIDADNAAAAIVEGFFEEIAKYGVASVKRIYGDWTGPQLGGWKKVLLDHPIQPIQQFAYTKGKNATDSSLIIDAMDLLYTRRFGWILPGFKRQRLHAFGVSPARGRPDCLRLR